ncbi:MAG TPA: exostosin family protein [Acidobacteriaceae bacterium]|jgi:hypothetical protein
MAKVLVISSAPGKAFAPWRQGTAFLLRHSAELDVFGEHTLTEDPDQADIILFAEMGECGFFAERVRAHPYYREYPEKCFLFDSADRPFPILPGIYASLTKQQYQPDHTRTGFYLYVIENPFIQQRPLTGQESFLASFIGNSRTHPVRDQIFAIQRGDFLLKDTGRTSYRMAYEADPAQRPPFWADYADAMASALFSLCPRGVGTGSVRLFESMKMGRPCIILADAWQPNAGVDWDSFSIRIPESDAPRIPELLERNADRAVEMGLCARAEWEKWFSEKVRFHRVVELCLDIQRSRNRFGRLERLYHLRHIPLHPRRYLSSKKFLYKRDGKIWW